MDNCPKCGGIRYSFESHKCPPMWLTNIEEWEGDKWVEVYARDAESAALKRAEGYDNNGDYPLMSGGSVIVRAKKIDGDIEYYLCEGESVPEYYAKKVDKITNE